MIYGTEPDYSELERLAWQKGDYQQAELCASLMGLSDAQIEADNLQSVLDNIQGLITEANWRTGKKAELRELIESIASTIAEG